MHWLIMSVLEHKAMKCRLPARHIDYIYRERDNLCNRDMLRLKYSGSHLGFHGNQS